MKKMATKRLMLAKETIRGLENSDLGSVAGGVTENCYSGNLGCEILKAIRKIYGDA